MKLYSLWAVAKGGVSELSKFPEDVCGDHEFPMKCVDS